jgi:hypothetical protein
MSTAERSIAAARRTDDRNQQVWMPEITLRATRMTSTMLAPRPTAARISS